MATSSSSSPSPGTAPTTPAITAELQQFKHGIVKFRNDYLQKHPINRQRERDYVRKLYGDLRDCCAQQPRYRNNDEITKLRYTKVGEYWRERLGIEISGDGDDSSDDVAGYESMRLSPISLGATFNQTELADLKLLKQGEKCWAAKRTHFYGGSTAYTRSCTDSTFRPWLLQRAIDSGLVREPDLAGNPHVQRGKDYEDPVRQLFIDRLRRQFGQQHVRMTVGGIYVPDDRDFHFVGYSPDGIIDIDTSDPDQRYTNGLLPLCELPGARVPGTDDHFRFSFELKLPGKQVYSVVYPNYLAQCQLSTLAISNCRKTLFVSCLIDILDGNNKAGKFIVTATNMFVIPSSNSYLDRMLKRAVYNIMGMETLTMPDRQVLDAIGDVPDTVDGMKLYKLTLQ